MMEKTIWPDSPPFFLTTILRVPEGVSLSCGCPPRKKDTISVSHDGDWVFWRHRCGASVGPQRKMHWQEADTLGLLGKF